jgi:hypothetical protein
MDQIWVVGATLRDDAGEAEARRLERAMSGAAGVSHVLVTAVGNGHLRVSFQIQASTAERAEHIALAVLERCARAVGVQVAAADATVR